MVSPARGVFGPRTTRSVREFQRAQGLGESGRVDGATLRKLIEIRAQDPRAGQGYLMLVLELAFTGMLRLAGWTAHFEGDGLFTAVNPNTDGAGVSFGLLQWTEKSGRLGELLREFEREEPRVFAEIFEDRSLRQRYLLAAGRDRRLQRVQARVAARDFRLSWERLRPEAPQARSERAAGFLLDLANQHGIGGAVRMIRRAGGARPSEEDLLATLEDESVALVERIALPNGDAAVKATVARRRWFRTSQLLSSEPLDSSVPGVQPGLWVVGANGDAALAGGDAPTERSSG